MQTQSERKGWRTGGQDFPVGVSPEDVEKAGNRLSKILANGHVLSAEETILLQQAFTLCHRTLAYQNHNISALDEFNNKLRELDKIIQSLGLKVLPQNLYITHVLAKNKDALKELCMALERKLPKIK